MDTHKSKITALPDKNVKAFKGFYSKLKVDLSNGVTFLEDNKNGEIGVAFFFELDYFQIMEGTKAVSSGSLLILGRSTNVLSYFKNAAKQSGQKEKVAYGRLHLDRDGNMHLIPEKKGRKVLLKTFVTAVKADPIVKSGATFWKKRKNNNTIIANDFIVKDGTEQQGNVKSIASDVGLPSQIFGDIATEIEKELSAVDQLADGGKYKEAYQKILNTLIPYLEQWETYVTQNPLIGTDTYLNGQYEALKEKVYLKQATIEGEVSHQVESADDIGEDQQEDEQLEKDKQTYEKELFKLYNDYNSAVDLKTKKEAVKKMIAWKEKVDASDLRMLFLPRLKKIVNDIKAFQKAENKFTVKALNSELMLKKMDKAEQLLIEDIDRVLAGDSIPEELRTLLNTWTA